VRRRRSAGDLAWNLLNYGALTLLGLAAAYPFVWVISASLSDPAEVLKGSVILLPRGFDTTNYGIVLGFAAIWTGYLNTLYYVIVGTTINIMLTMLFAYPLSRIWFRARGAVNLFMIVTMFFGGGMIPTFLVVKALGLVDSRWAMIIPGAISAWNVIMARTYLSANIPDEMIEAAHIDGADDLRTLWSVVMPLSGPILAVIGLYYAVAHWNDYFSALLYLRDDSQFPLQVILRQVVQSPLESLALGGGRTLEERSLYSRTVQYAVIVVSTVPILLVYPLLQRYFVKGVMVGALKG